MSGGRGNLIILPIGTSLLRYSEMTVAVTNWFTADSGSGRVRVTDGVEEGIMVTAVGGDSPFHETVTSVESIILKNTRDD